jgi:hypothetical protein
LPLSSNASRCSGSDCGSCISDRDDLIDFLGTDVRAMAGIEPPSTASSLASETLQQYQAVLDLAGDPEVLANSDALRQAARRIGARVTDDVVDARYAPGSFASIQAIRYRSFWFMFYQPPGKGLTRLVVIPRDVKRAREEKRPTGGSR